MNSFKAVLALSTTLYGSTLMANNGQRIAAKTGMDTGGLIVGGEYEVVDTANESFVGFFSLHSKDTDKGAPGLTSLGGALKLRWTQGAYEVFMSPGLGIISYDLGDDDDLLIGPRISMGLYAKLDQYLAIGVENEKLYSWIGEVEGLINDSFLVNFQFAL